MIVSRLVIALVSFLRAHYRVIVSFIVGCLLTALFFRATRDDPTKIVEDVNARHAQEVQEIVAAHEEEVEKFRENEKILTQRLREIEEVHVVAETKLEEEKKTIAQKIVKENGDSPDELAKVLSNATGLTVTK